jgi:hypothetical protein
LEHSIRVETRKPVDSPAKQASWQYVLSSQVVARHTQPMARVV